MIKHLLFVFLLCVTVSASAQEKKDSIPYRRILLLPFEPQYYLSDAEQDLMAANHETPDDYRRIMRQRLDLKIQAELESLIPVVSLLNDTTAAARNDMNKYYGRSEFVYAQPFGTRSANNSLKDKTKKTKEQQTDPQASPHYLTVRGNEQFMNNAIRDTVVLREIASHAKADLILAINQLEIRTNYNTCLDIANRVYQRELLISYTLLKPDGKALQGNVAVAYFPSNSNRIKDITEKSFPDIGKFIRKQVETMK